MGLSSRFGHRAYGTGSRWAFNPSWPETIGCSQMLLPRVGGGQDLAALGRQLRQGQTRFWLRRLSRRLGVEHLILEPVSEIGRAAGFSLGGLRLLFAGGAAGWAFDADMKMIVVAPVRSDLGKPAAIVLSLTAQRLLDRGIDEDALDIRLLRGIANDGQMLRGPGMRIDVEPVGAHHHLGRHLFALVAR